VRQEHFQHQIAPNAICGAQRRVPRTLAGVDIRQVYMGAAFDQKFT
jgi:hypothetical protein